MDESWDQRPSSEHPWNRSFNSAELLRTVRSRRGDIYAGYWPGYKTIKTDAGGWAETRERGCGSSPGKVCTGISRELHPRMNGLKLPSMLFN